MPAVDTVALLVVGERELRIWSVPQLNPIEYLPMDSMRERLLIPEELVDRIVRYDPASNILLIVQPLHSIKLTDLRKILYRRPRLPQTLEEEAETIRAYAYDVIADMPDTL